MRSALTALIVLLLAVSFEASAQDTKLYVVTHVDLTPNYIADGTPLLKKFAVDSRKDPGVVRFEMLVDVSRKNHFTIVSVWENQAAFDAHLEANHTKQLREKLQPMLGSPFDERLSVVLQ
jgi:quinol monooxygenase YgiN